LDGRRDPLHVVRSRLVAELLHSRKVALPLSIANEVCDDVHWVGHVINPVW
jgi:hypothetical protein